MVWKNNVVNNFITSKYTWIMMLKWWKTFKYKTFPRTPQSEYMYLYDHGLVQKRSDEACHPGGHYWNYYPGTLSCNQVSAFQLKIGHRASIEEISSTGAWSSNELQWLELKIGHQDNSTSKGHQEDIPYSQVKSLLQWPPPSTTLPTNNMLIKFQILCKKFENCHRYSLQKTDSITTKFCTYLDSCLGMCKISLWPDGYKRKTCINKDISMEFDLITDLFLVEWAADDFVLLSVVTDYL